MAASRPAGSVHSPHAESGHAANSLWPFQHPFPDAASTGVPSSRGSIYIRTGAETGKIRRKGVDGADTGRRTGRRLRMQRAGTDVLDGRQGETRSTTHGRLPPFGACSIRRVTAPRVCTYTPAEGRTEPVVRRQEPNKQRQCHLGFSCLFLLGLAFRRRGQYRGKLV